MDKKKIGLIRTLTLLAVAALGFFSGIVESKWTENKLEEKVEEALAKRNKD